MITTLRALLVSKHHETFWVKASAIKKDELDWFRYDHVTHTKNPNDALLAPLIETDKITLELQGYFSKQSNMKWRDHGMLFKMWPSDLPLLFGEPIEYDLNSLSQSDIV